MSFSIPNLLSLFRMGLVPLFIIAVVDGRPGRALLFFVAAGVTDALDGFIARFWHQQTPLGTYLDPIADKLLLSSAYVVLAIPGLNPVLPVPVWVTVLVLARDVLIVLVALAVYLATGHKSFPPTVLGKVTTAVQVATVVLVLALGVWRGVPGLTPVAVTAIYLTAALTVGSGLSYVLRSHRSARPEEG